MSVAEWKVGKVESFCRVPRASECGEQVQLKIGVLSAYKMKACLNVWTSGG